MGKNYLQSGRTGDQEILFRSRKKSIFEIKKGYCWTVKELDAKTT